MEEKLDSTRFYITVSIMMLIALTTLVGVGFSALNQDLNVSGDIDYEQDNKLLYNVLKKEANSGGFARKYTGVHHDSFTEEPSKDIYYYYSVASGGSEILDKNNVIFAEHCWQMIRTTDTGGVKMIYNGEAEDGKCLNTRGNHVGYNDRGNQNLASNYWYGDSYSYDSSTNLFSIDGNTLQETWNATTGPNLIGKYTCKSTSVDGTCSTLYLVESYRDASSAFVLNIVSNSHYSQFGKLNYNSSTNSAAYAGYMYNKVYGAQMPSISYSEIMLQSTSLSTNFWYGHSVVWGTPQANKYNLDSPYQVSATTDYPNLVGEYTFRNGNQTYANTSVYYIAAVNNSTMYYIQFNNSGDHTLASFDYTYTFGTSYTDNGDGTYTIDNPSTVKRSDWYTGYSSVGRYKYVCKNAVNDTCSDLWYTTSISNTTMSYIKVSNVYKYSKSFTWDGTKYILDNNNSVTFWDISDSTNKASINNAHYTCWNDTGECTDISYIYYIEGDIPCYITIKDGKGVEDAIDEMLYASDVNRVDSVIKKGLEAWYKKYLLDTDSYIEDIIFCSNRSLSSLGGWNPDGGSVAEYEYMKFGSNGLSCQNDTDKFSVSNNNAKLKYPVALITSTEMRLLNSNSVSSTGQSYWLGDANVFGYSGRFLMKFMVYSSGSINSSDIARGVRPAISLIPGTEYADGDGSMDNPYVVISNMF